MEAATATQRHTEAKTRVTAYKPKAFEVPTEPGCAGDCTQPVPMPPVLRSRESFVSRPSAPEGARVWLLIMSVAAIGYAVITLGKR
jgi:hypothetical protein